MRDTIDMAREVELDELLEQMPRIAKKFKAFEALVRADERSVERAACAKFFDLNDTNLFWGSQAAKYIRARGETK